jgi:hypothetical protein
MSVAIPVHASDQATAKASSTISGASKARASKKARNATKVLDRLEGQRLVRREPDPADGGARSSALSTTEPTRSPPCTPP